MSKKPKILVSWPEAEITEDDMRILESTEWLNDHIITFCFEHLNRVFKRKDVLCIGAETSFWLANCPDNEDVQNALENLGFFDIPLVLFPINNNVAIEEAGGSHWSLLAWQNKKDGREGKWFHLDSEAPLNLEAANRLAIRICEAVGQTFEEDVNQVPCARQANGYDCGVHVIALADVICQRKRFDIVDFKMEVPHVRGKRSELASLIQQYFKKDTPKPRGQNSGTSSPEKTTTTSPSTAGLARR